jgi:RimJ/RimL family protein N-acetyltransferase
MLTPAVHAAKTSGTWRHKLPVISAGGVTIRELRRDDAPTLLKMLADPAVWQHMAPAPDTLQRFQRFIAWTRAGRRAGRYICFGIVPPDSPHAVGLVQMWPLEPAFGTAEWGFMIGRPYWGSGIFTRAAELFLEFAVRSVGVHRLEARAAVENVSGHAALRRLGAHPEGVLRKCFHVRGELRDHTLWAILSHEWRAARAVLASDEGLADHLPVEPAYVETGGHV